MATLTNKELVQLFINIVHQYSPDVFLEIGCLEGSTSKIIKNSLPDCEVYAYEADPINFITYNYNLKEAGINHIWAAISDETKETIFYVQNPRKDVLIWGNNSLKTKPNPYNKYIEFPIKSYTLDFLHKQGKTYCMWIDAEGLAYQVLKGAKAVLTCTKYILVEVESEELWENQIIDTKVIDFLAKKGFELLAKDQEYPSQYNILFQNRYI